MKNKTKRAMTAFFAVLMAGSLVLPAAAQEAQPETEAVSEEAQSETEAADEEGSFGQVASSDEMVTPEEVVTDDMEPVYADSLKEGTYSIDVLSSSSMFRIIDCQLTVADGEMSAVMTLNGDGYMKLFMGTGEEAAAASPEEYISYEENEEGKQMYEVPVEALDMGIDCAAFSRKKEKWYDRVLVFSAASLPQDAYQDGLIVTAEQLGIADGSYTIEVTLEGGSGKAGVESPAALTVEGGSAYAVITFSSPYYDYVLVDGEKYLRTNEEGNSTFEIPVTSFDWKMPITADTTAMSTPHEIDYTLYFDSATLQQN